MSDIKELKLKMCLLGEAAVGKTSLIRKFVVDKFDDKYITTLGTKTSKKTFSSLPKSEGPEISTLHRFARPVGTSPSVNGAALKF